MTTRRTRNRTRALVAVALSGLLLGGCGSARPGVAAQVGDTRISVSDVNRLAEAYCSFYERRLESQSTAVPMDVAKASVVDALAMQAVGQQLADDYAVQPGTSYTDARANLEQTAAAAGADEDVTEAVVTVDSTIDYVSAVLVEIGRELLAEEGVEDAADEAALERGTEVLGTWLADNEPEIDPRYGMALVTLQPERVDTSTSFAVSEAATGASTENLQDQAAMTAYARTLPESQRCG